MSDTTTTSTPPQVNQGEVQPTTAPSAQASSPVSSEPTTPAPQVDVYTREQLNEMLSKARKEEKEKLYKALEKVKSEHEASQAERDRVNSELQTATERLKALEGHQMSDMAKFTEQLEALRKQNEELQTRLNSVVTDAEKKIKQSELNAYKAKRLEQEGILMPELVNGSSADELEASIKAVKERQEAIRKEAEERVRKELSANLPRPVGPSGESATAPAANRYEMSKMKPAEYDAMRKKLLAQAMDSIRN